MDRDIRAYVTSVATNTGLSAERRLQAAQVLAITDVAHSLDNLVSGDFERNIGSIGRELGGVADAIRYNR